MAWNPVAGLLACFDGWLDDLPALRSELSCAAAASPALVVLEGYARYGDGLPRRLRGDYALVVWDRSLNRVFAARDPFGIRPLHYATVRERLYVTSGAEQIVQAGVVAVVPDDRMVVGYLARRVVSRNRSFFQGVWQVPAGHQLSVQGLEVRLSEHRRPPPTALRFADTGECHEAVRHALEVAVRRSLSADEGVAIELSGGLDSSSITCLADRIEAEEGRPAGRVVAIAGIHPGMPYDESAYIREIEASVRVPVICWDATEVDARDIADPLFAAPGSRVVMSGGGNGMVAIAREHGATMLLNGTGGDQLGQPLGVLADKFRGGQWRSALGDLARSGLSFRQSARALLRTGHELSPPVVRRWRRWARGATSAPAWLTPSAAALWRDGEAEVEAEDDARHSTVFLSAAQRLRWRNLTDPRLGYALDVMQRFAASNGLEGRFPFLDWDLVSLVCAIPIEHWPVSGRNPRIHREALASILPPALHRRRTKAEFTPAVAARVTAQLPVIEALFGRRSWRSERYVTQSSARELLASFRATSAPDLTVSYSLNALASLETWLGRVLRYTPATHHGDVVAGR